MQLFVSDESFEMVTIGTSYLTLMAFFYLLPAFTNGIQGFFRGMGYMKITLTGTIIQISLRFIFVYLLVPKMGLTAVAYASLIGWICMLLTQIPYYFLQKKKMGL
jgi:Na+-driven multidrug efflux pump